MWPFFGFIPGLVAGVVALVVLAIRAAIEGRAGVSFGDLWTAAAVGAAVAIAQGALAAVMTWRARRTWRTSSEQRGYGPGRAEHGSSRFVNSGSPGGMVRFDKFTDRARKVLTLAQDEAQRFSHNYIGTEHILLGLIREDKGAAAQVLQHMNVELPKVRTAVEFIIGRGERPVVGEVGLTPEAKRVIELAIDEARRLDHHYLGTEHLLLGLVREGTGLAAGVLESLGVNLDKVRHEVIRLTAGEGDNRD
jgi:hypothetical protein